jgi:predicted amidophosphoribosyltransferase
LLERHRATDILFPLTADGRRRMLRGAFACADAESVKGKAILLIDDIMTTGTTGRECSKTLLKAGAKSVHIATLARAQKESTAQWKMNVAEMGLTQKNSN